MIDPRPAASHTHAVPCHHQDLEAEKATWITPENLESRITEDLFAKQATTGIVTRTSQHWRWQIVPLNLQRLMSEEFRGEPTESTLTDRLAQRGQVRSTKKLIVQDILDPMIGSGKDRARYKELVDKFSVQFEEMGALRWVDEYYADLLEVGAMGAMGGVLRTLASHTFPHVCAGDRRSGWRRPRGPSRRSTGTTTRASTTTTTRTASVPPPRDCPQTTQQRRRPRRKAAERRPSRCVSRGMCRTSCIVKPP